MNELSSLLEKINAGTLPEGSEINLVGKAHAYVKEIATALRSGK